MHKHNPSLYKFKVHWRCEDCTQAASKQELVGHQFPDVNPRKMQAMYNHMVKQQHLDPTKKIEIGENTCYENQPALLPWDYVLEFETWCVDTPDNLNIHETWYLTPYTDDHFLEDQYQFIRHNGLNTCSVECCKFCDNTIMLMVATREITDRCLPTEVKMTVPEKGMDYWTNAIWNPDLLSTEFVRLHHREAPAPKVVK